MKDHFYGFSYLYDKEQTEVDERAQHIAKNHFLHLAGVSLNYFGADSGDNTFKVDGIVFKVLENPDDGYRSHLGAVDYTDHHSSIFFHQPIAKVRIEEFDEEDTGWSSQQNKGYKLVDVSDGHVWLEFGTWNYNDYYPCFLFRHNPKPSKI